MRDSLKSSKSYTIDQQEQLISYFSRFITLEKLAKIDRILVNRTRHVTIALEDVYQSLNISAILRSAECFGIQDVHVIEQRHAFVHNEGVDRGAAQWLSIHRYNQPDQDNMVSCIRSLKQSGYTIVATTPEKYDCLIEDVPLDKKTAWLFGTEMVGLSDQALAQADMRVKIPMFGFTQSFNISVSVALCLYSFVSRLHKSDVQWRMNYEQMLGIKLDWMRTMLSRADLLEKLFWQEAQE